MLVDWLIYGLLVFGVAKLLNATIFKLRPASRPAAWGLTILMFFVSVVALSALKVLRYQAISDRVGVSISPRIDDLFKSKKVLTKQARNESIYSAHIRYGYTLKEIADYLDIHYTTVSKAINSGKGLKLIFQDLTPVDVA